MKTATLQKNKIILRFPYDMATIQLVRSIEGRKWDDKNKYWTLPSSSWHAQEVIDYLQPQGFEVSKEIHEMASVEAHLPDLDLPVGLYPFQQDAVKFLYAIGGRAIIADEMGCISGESIITVNRGGAGFKMSLRELYEKFNGISGNWDNSIETRTRSVIESTGDLRLNTIKKVLHKGVKPVIRIFTANGKSIKLTPDHEVYTPVGWVSAGELSPGETIYTNGRPRCLRCGSFENISTYKYAKYRGYCKECIYKYLREDKWNEDNEHEDKEGYIRVSKCWNHPNSDAYGRCLKHRLVIEANLNGLSYEAWINLIRNSEFNSERWITLDTEVSVHHIDEYKRNNNIENLQVLTPSEHARIHANPNVLSEHMSIKADTVLTISEEGEEEVFDIIMSDPHRSFVADGIVVHNCGKTIEALAYASLGSEKILIVSPSNVLYKWEAECKKWMPKLSVAVYPTGKGELGEENIHILSYGIMVSRFEQLKEVPYDLMIFDEAHLVKNSKAMRTRVTKALVGTGVPGLLFLSGTPFMNRPAELFTLVNMIDPKGFPNFYSYATRYCAAVYNSGVWYFPPNGVSNIEELSKRLESIMIRRTKRDVLKDLPDLTRTSVPVEIDNLREYKSAVKDIRTWLSTQKKELISPEHALTRLNVLRQIVGKGKITAAIELAESVLNDGKKVVLFAHHKEVVAQLETGLAPFGVGIISGSVPAKKRQQLVDEFLKHSNDSLMPYSSMRVMIITVAGAEGIDLYSASDIIFVEREWTPAKEEQAESRLHRNGQKNPVNAWYIVATGTVDEKFDRLVKEKRKIFSQVIKTDEILELLYEE